MQRVLTGALVAALLALVYTGHCLSRAEARLHREREAHSAFVTGHMRIAQAAETAARTREAALQAKVDEASHALHQTRADTARSLSAVRADRDRLRIAIASYAAGGGGTAPDTVAACRDRADSLGDVLDGVLQDYAAAVGAAEDRAAEVRALLQAWPK